MGAVPEGVDVPLLQDGEHFSVDCRARLCHPSLGSPVARMGTEHRGFGDIPGLYLLDSLAQTVQPVTHRVVGQAEVGPACQREMRGMVEDLVVLANRLGLGGQVGSSRSRTLRSKSQRPPASRKRE